MCEPQNLFSPLDEKIKLVKTWPGISDCFSEADFKCAVEKAHESGLMGRFAVVSEKYALLAVVVSVFLGSVVETFKYGRNRLRDAIGRERYTQDRFEEIDLDSCLMLLPGVVDRRNCLAVEVVDLGAHYNSRKPFDPIGVRSVNSAHAQVLFAGAQDVDWVHRMDPKEEVPFAHMGGYRMTNYTNTHAPCLQVDQHGVVGLLLRHLDHSCATDAQPTVWR